MNLQNNKKNGTLFTRLKRESGDAKSWLTVIDEFPFEVKRFFYLDVEGGIARGDHAHKKNKQLLLCVSGQFQIRTHDGNGGSDFFILNSDDYYFHDSMEWINIRAIDDEEDPKTSSILLSFCSEDYDEDDYIRKFAEFETLVAEKKAKETTKKKAPAFAKATRNKK